MHYAQLNKNSWFKHLKYVLVMTGLSTAFSSSVWAIDPSVKELRIGFQKARSTLQSPSSKSYLRKNFQTPKLAGMNFQQDHKFWRL